jgi:hypothetical protein
LKVLFSDDYLLVSLDHARFSEVPGIPSHQENSIRLETGTSDLRIPL